MAKKKATESTWNNVSGIMRVFTNLLEAKKGSWYKSSVSVGSKDQDGDYHNFYFDIKFGKKAEEPDTFGPHTLDVKEAFFTTEYWKDKKTKEERIKPVLFIQECEIID